MPRFDIEGRQGRLTLLMCEDGREYRFDSWPFETDNPVEVKLLRSYHATVELPQPKPKPRASLEAKKPLPLPARNEEV